MRFPGFFDEHISNLLPKDGVMEYKFPFYDAIKSKNLFEKLLKEIHWKAEKIIMYGKIHDVPRLTAWYGDQAINYTYSGINNAPIPWIPTLLEMKNDVELYSGEKFNSVLLNLYRDGEDHVSWHADDEPELGSGPTIVSVSLGETRKFQVKHKYEKALPTISLNLESGSLVIMRGEMQAHWNHRIAKTTKSLSPRINLTFRCIY